MQFAASLTGGSFDEARMLQNVEACEWLTGALRGLQVPNLDPSYASMRAVCPISLSLLFGFFFLLTAMCLRCVEMQEMTWT